MKILLPLFVRKKEREQEYSLLAANLLEHQEVGGKNNTDENYQQITADVLTMVWREK